MKLKVQPLQLLKHLLRFSLRMMVRPIDCEIPAAVGRKSVKRSFADFRVGPVTLKFNFVF